jgi:hypothetical protein
MFSLLTLSYQQGIEESQTRRQGAITANLSTRQGNLKKKKKKKKKFPSLKHIAILLTYSLHPSQPYFLTTR